jgi:hypothetical protein
MSVWLRYLAVVVLVGNGFTAVWNLIALGRSIHLGASSADEVGLMAFNLVFSFAAIALAVLIAVPTRRGVDLRTKVIAAPSIVSGGLGILSAAMVLYARASQPAVDPLTGGLDAAIGVLTMERGVQNAFFSACTLALAIAVIASRRSSG